MRFLIIFDEYILITLIYSCMIDRGNYTLNSLIINNLTQFVYA